jgi:hypothetical protein
MRIFGRPIHPPVLRIRFAPDGSEWLIFSGKFSEVLYLVQFPDVYKMQ